MNLFFSNNKDYQKTVEKIEKKVEINNAMSIQVLQYEFLGPIKIDEWGPPMENTIYLIMVRKNDVFEIIYAGDCVSTNDIGFFTQNSAFKCWISKSGKESSLYLAIYPMINSLPEQRKLVISKIISKYQPRCNQEIPEKRPDYLIRPQHQNKIPEKSKTETILCPCCGSEMKILKILEKSSIIKCQECGLSDTRLNS